MSPKRPPRLEPFLAESDDRRRWHRNVAQGSRATADVYVRRLAALLALAILARVRPVRDAVGRRAVLRVATVVDRAGFIHDPRGRGQTTMSAGAVPRSRGETDVTEG